jgi:archaellum component FlaC
MDNLVGGSGSPHDRGMEARVQRLEDMLQRVEALMKSVDDQLRRVEIELAELKGRVATLPSTWAMVTTIVGGQGAFAAVLLALLRFAAPH